MRGFRTTTVAETVLLLAADLPLARLEAVLEEGLLTGRVRLEEFDPIFDRIVGSRLRGAGRLRRLIESRQPEAFSVDSTYLERLLERILSDPRLPHSTRESPMSINGRPSRVDAYLPSWKLVVEADSRRWHARQADFERDKLRDNALAAEGIVVLRFSYQMLRQDPGECLQTIMRAGSHRRALSP